MVTPNSWLIPLAFLGGHFVFGAVTGCGFGAIASLVHKVRRSRFVIDALLGGLAGLVGGGVVGYANAAVTTFVNGSALGGWQAFVVNYALALSAALVIVVVTIGHVIAAAGHREARDAA